MTKREQMLSVLRAAEDGLARLAADAGVQREYADAAALLEAARRVQQIGEETRLSSDGDASAASSVAASNVTSPQPAVVSSEGRPSTNRRPRKADYPQFFRDGDTLIKVGWSKSEGSEYEHKCPKRVLDVLVAELSRLAGPGRRFVMDKVLPLRDPNTKAEFPTYQPYLALAFLRQAGLIEQHGRSGYSIPKQESFVTAAAAGWNGINAR